MTKTLTRTVTAMTAALIFTLFLSTAAFAQFSYPDPYLGRPTQRDARLAYLAAQRAKAAVPVNYTFSVRPDIATAYNAAAYSPQYRYSRYVSAFPADRNAAAHQTSQQTAYRPNTPPYTAYANPYATNPYATNPYATNPSGTERSSCAANPAIIDSYNRAAVAPRGDVSPYYVGTSLAGPPKVYPTDEPVRNLFRYLFP